MKKMISFLIILISLISICGCSETTDNGKLKVVTTIFPIYDMVRYIGEDLVDISMMVSPGQDIHSYDPSASDIIDAKKCDLLLYIGDSMESWVKDINTVDNHDRIVIALSSDERIELDLDLLGYIKEDILPLDELYSYLIKYLKENYPNALNNRYKVDSSLEEYLLTEQIARNRGLLLKGGAIDEDSTKKLVLKEFKEGILTRVVIDDA